MSLVGRVCLVTGASRGIGKGVAKALTSQGFYAYHKLCVASRRREKWQKSQIFIQGVKS